MPISVVRDDLYPFVGGGNKARKIIHIAEKVEELRCNAVVTTGGIQSNHCRAVAVMAAIKGWKCKIILHGDRDRFYSESGNAKIIRLTGVEVEFCKSEEIAFRMDKAMDDFSKLGFKPYYIRGGGHELNGGLAYVNAVEELYHFCKKVDIFPDYIFHASGTGSTQAGILAGLDLVGLNTKVYGISVARKRENAERVVNELYVDLMQHKNIRCKARDVIVLDDFLAGGYECVNNEIKSTIKALAVNTGMFTDPTYSGKAFWGMYETIKRERLNGRVLFWHTGGINNLLSSNII